MLVEVVRRDEAGRCYAAFPVVPQVGDEVHLGASRRNLDGWFLVERRRIRSGRTGSVVLVVSPAAEATNGETVAEAHREKGHPSAYGTGA